MNYGKGLKVLSVGDQGIGQPPERYRRCPEVKKLEN